MAHAKQHDGVQRGGQESVPVSDRWLRLQLFLRARAGDSSAA
ncbi:hypothetical protein [Streptomyces sp. TLI_55]|nr:hypothetical protein [Streptomyces sp. TLI_55]